MFHICFVHWMVLCVYMLACRVVNIYSKSSSKLFKWITFSQCYLEKDRHVDGYADMYIRWIIWSGCNCMLFFHRVACSMMSYSDGYVVSDRWAGSGRILLDQVSCKGTETRISDCPHRSWGRNSCNHNEDVSVRCVGPMTTHTTAGPRLGEKSVL